MMKRSTLLIAGAGIGAALMYALDPGQGRARRARIEDQLDHAKHVGGREFSRRTHDVENRVQGYFAELLGRLRSEQVDDDTLTARVRSKLGRVTRHAHTVDVRSLEGWITLEGLLPQEERQEVLRAIGRVRGVRGVEDRLRVLSSNRGTEMSRTPIGSFDEPSRS
jgi:hypothetical protein